jgi:hypothetical protein
MTFNLNNAKTDIGKKSKATRMAITMNTTPKDRSKARATTRPGFKKRGRK